MGLVQKQHGFLQDAARLILHAADMGFEVTGGELERTEYQQEHYVSIGRSKTMRSDHLRRMAIDLNFFLDGVYIGGLPATEAKEIIQPLGDWWVSQHPQNYWGGNFRTIIDVPHFGRKG